MRSLALEKLNISYYTWYVKGRLKMRYRYWLTLRPAMPGTIPTDNLVWINNFDSRTYEEEVGREVWGYVEYSRRLPDMKVVNYELIEAKRG